MRFRKKHPLLFDNIFAILIFQTTSYVVPLITLPYLVRVLRPDRFGLLAFAQAFVQYFVVLVDYGFNLTATRQVAIHREDRDRLSAIFSTVMVIKGLLTILAIIILSIVVFSIRKFSPEWRLYYLTFFTVIGSVLFPAWFFQGTENMKAIVLPNLVARLFAVSLIFLLIRQESDYLLASFLPALGSILSGLLSIIVLKRRYQVRFMYPTWNEIAFHMRDGFHIFLSTSSTSLYTATNVFVLGIFSNNTVVGFYSASERIIRATLGLLTPVTLAIYPHINALAAQSKESARKFITVVLKHVGTSTLLLSSTLFIFADSLVGILLGSNFRESAILLRIMAFLPFIVAISNVLGVQTMVTFGFSRDFSRVVMYAAILNLAMVIPMSIYFEDKGVAISYVVTELFIASMFVVFIYREKLFIRETPVQ